VSSAPTIELTDDEKIRRLPWAFGHIAANAVFAHLVFAGPVFVLFLTELNLSKAQIGVLLALFPLAGLAAPLVAPAVARAGYKRTFLALWLARKVVAAGLLLTPFIASRYGAGGTVTFVTAVFATFALCRAVAETGMYPWLREFVPDRVRGRFVALDNIVFTAFGFLAVGLAGYVIGQVPGVGGFMRLIAIGVPFGFIAVAAAVFIPGGAPIAREGASRLDLRTAAAVLRDARFSRFLAGLGLMVLAAVPLNSFLPLFARERIGLPQANVIFLQNAVLAGALLSSYLWGWAADRWGSKPVMLLGVAMSAAVALAWLGVPRQGALSFALALSAAFVTGLAGPAWSIGSSRFLFIDVVPQAAVGNYMALYYAWAGLTGALGASLAGRLLQGLQSGAGSSIAQRADAYSPLFIGSVALACLSLAILAGARPRRQLAA
jgi:MFS family permease